MAFDNLCSTKLSLSLGTNDKNIHVNPHHKNKASQRLDLDDHDHHPSFPSLTLGLSNELHGVNRLDIAVKGGESGGETYNNIHVEASQGSAASSFSNGSVKREREVSVEDVENDRESPKVGDDQDEDGPRKKLRLSKDQALVLEDSFKEHSTLNPKQKQALANMLNLRPRQVEVWFQNRRARTKLKQTETDCEIWKKCCESLREENKRLHKELQDLKASKLTTPYYMQLPATTLNMCPSCHRIGAAAGEKSSKISFSMGAKPHFYSPFTHPYAAC